MNSAISRWTIAGLLSVGVASSGCNSCGSEESPEESVPLEEDAVEPTPQLTINQLVRRHAGEPLSSVAVAPDGQVALFGQSGAFVVTKIEAETEDPPTQQTTSPVMDSAWIDESIVGLETTPSALVLWDAGGAEQARIELPGEPVDLWADDERSVVWTLTRVGSAAEVRAHAVTGEALEPRLTHAIGGQPVGLYGGSNSVYAPTFVDRTVTEFSTTELAWQASTPVDSRPLFVHPMDAGFAVVGANSEEIQLLGASPSEPVSMVQPQWIQALGDAAYAFTPGDSVLHRLDAQTLVSQASNEDFGLVIDATEVDSGLVVIDAGSEPTIALLDPDSLELLAGRVPEGRPASIVAMSDDSFLVVSPAEGMVTTYQVVIE